MYKLQGGLLSVVGFPVLWFRYGIRCADNHTGILTPSMLNVTRIKDTNAGHVLEINLAENNLTGTLPQSISDFFYLRCGVLRCHEGLPVPTPPPPLLPPMPVPCSVLSTEWLHGCMLPRHFYMDGNTLSGRIPATIGRLPWLAIARFSNNVLTSSIPRCALSVPVSRTCACALHSWVVRG